MAEQTLSNASVKILAGLTTSVAAVFDFDGVNFVEGGFPEKNAGSMTELGNIDAIMLSAPTMRNLGTVSALLERKETPIPVLLNTKPLESPKADSIGEIVKYVKEANARLFYDSPLLFNLPYTPRIIHQSAKGTLSLYVLAGDTRDGMAITKALATGDETLVEKAAAENGTVAVLLWRPAMLNSSVVRVLISGTCSMDRIKQSLDKASKALPFLDAPVVSSKNAMLPSAKKTSKQGTAVRSEPRPAMRPRTPSELSASAVRGAPTRTESSSAPRPGFPRAGPPRNGVPLRTGSSRPVASRETASPATNRARQTSTKPRVPLQSGRPNAQKNSVDKVPPKVKENAPDSKTAAPAPSAPPAEDPVQPEDTSNQSDSVICLDDSCFSSTSDVVVISPAPSSIDADLINQLVPSIDGDKVNKMSPTEAQEPFTDENDCVAIVDPSSLPVENCVIVETSVEHNLEESVKCSTEEESPTVFKENDINGSDHVAVATGVPQLDDENTKSLNKETPVRLAQVASSDQCDVLNTMDGESKSVSPRLEKSSTPLAPLNGENSPNNSNESSDVDSHSSRPTGDMTQLTQEMDHMQLNSFNNSHSATLYMQKLSGRPTANDVKFARPYYFDLVTVPHNGKLETTLNARSLQEFFAKIRSRNFVLPSAGISAEQLEGVLDGKRKWADNANSCKIIATHSSESMSRFLELSENKLTDVNTSIIIPSETSAKSENVSSFYELAHINF